MRKIKVLVLLVLTSVIFSCEKQEIYSPYAQLEEDVLKIDKYLEENNITAVQTRSGLRYVIEKEGLGDVPQRGNTLKVHYTGTLLDSTKFDSSYDRGDPLEYIHGVGKVIQGWDEGMAYIGEHGKIILYVPSVLAYGRQGAGNLIGPNENLIFYVELLSVQ
jgi:FKBP-type peptidyl-prolyl cis-trans isomerase